MQRILLWDISRGKYFQLINRCTDERRVIYVYEYSGEKWTFTQPSEIPLGSSRLGQQRGTDKTLAVFLQLGYEATERAAQRDIFLNFPEWKISWLYNSYVLHIVIWFILLDNLYISIYTLALKKQPLYMCLNAAAAVTIYAQLFLQWTYRAPSSAGLNCPYSTKAMEQCYLHSPGFEPAPPKSSSKTKPLFPWKGSHWLQWEFGSALIQAISLETRKAGAITRVLSFPILRYLFFLEAGGRETFYLSDE